MIKMFEFLFLQNSDLTTKLKVYEDTCVCYPQCTIGSRTFDEGQRWEEGRCVICTCRVSLWWIKALYLYWNTCICIILWKNCWIGFTGNQLKNCILWKFFKMILLKVWIIIYLVLFNIEVIEPVERVSSILNIQQTVKKL